MIVSIKKTRKKIQKTRGIPKFFRSKKGTLLTFVLSLIISYGIFVPRVTTVEEKELSITLASTDCPPYSLQATLLNAIDYAHSSIDIAIYAIQDHTIVQHLKAVARKGVKVTVIVDPSASPDASFLLGKDITVHERPMKGLMHTKLIIIDKKIVWYGTMNLTKTSLLTHGNMGCGIYSTKLASVCLQFMQSLIEKTKNIPLPLIRITEEEEDIKKSPSVLFSLHPNAASESLKELVHRINTATKRVFVAMYTFTHPAIAQALIDAKKRNVDVRVLFDRDSSRETSKKIYSLLKKSSVPIGVRTKQGLLHYKCAIIDSSFVIGSANWTKAAFTLNAETFSILDMLPEHLLIFLVDWWKRIELDSTLSSDHLPSFTELVVI